VIGLILGYMMIGSGTYLAPALAHGLYDFVALLYILKRANWVKNSQIEENS
jgi:membrane protease YdiL (CAAX protease family)